MAMSRTANVERAIKACHKGMGPAEAARKFAVDLRNLQRALRAEGVAARPVGRPRKQHLETHPPVDEAVADF